MNGGKWTLSYPHAQPGSESGDYAVALNSVVCGVAASQDQWRVWQRGWGQNFGVNFSSMLPSQTNGENIRLMLLMVFVAKFINNSVITA